MRAATTAWHRGRPVLAVTVAVAVLATGLFLAGAVLVGRPPPAPAGAGTGEQAVPVSAVAPARGSLQADIAAVQAHLRDKPDDRAAWGRLGAAYVEQARVSGDPSYYGRAEEALRRSEGTGGAPDPAALAGLGALANARHRFAEARDLANRALAAGERNQAAHGVLVDALTQLGDYPAATTAAQRMLDLRPDVASYTRASYELELHGDTGGARAALERALSYASVPADIAFCRQYLGQLALSTGKPKEALHQYAQGLAAAPDSGALLAGKAKAEAAAGDVPGALRDYAAVTARMPLPQYLLEYAELAQAAGRRDDAGRQYALVLTQQRLLAANGVVDDLFLAQYEADHGDAAKAVQHARTEWNPDALAWALHQAGRNAEALRYAEAAGRLGWRNALFAYHRGMIARALGQREPARRSLAAALALDPHFSPLHAPRARQALAELERAR